MTAKARGLPASPWHCLIWAKTPSTVKTSLEGVLLCLAYASYSRPGRGHSDGKPWPHPFQSKLLNNRLTAGCARRSCGRFLIVIPRRVAGKMGPCTGRPFPWGLPWPLVVSEGESTGEGLETLGNTFRSSLWPIPPSGGFRGYVHNCAYWVRPVFLGVETPFHQHR